jgi:hypothetical protein
VAQESAPVSVDVSPCVKLTTPEERLACFEAQVEAAGAAQPAGAASGAGAAAAGAAPAAGAAAAGATAAGPSTASAGRARAPDDAEEAPPDIHATIAALRETVPNSYLITLDNGQVWRQTVPDIYPLRTGMSVRIYYSRWRAYRLTAPDLRGFIQVERAR